MGRGMAANRILRASLGLFFFLTPVWAWQSSVPAASQGTDPPAQDQAQAASRSTKLPEEYRQWLNEEVPYLISDRERDEFQALLTDADRQRFIERFWRLRDPDPFTEANEFRSQHLQRVRQANDKFSEGVPGWKTARGRVWIMHGPPDSIHFDVGGSMLELKIFRPTEVLAENSSVYKTPFARISLEMPDSEVWVYHHLEGARHFPGTFEVIFSRANRTGLWSAAQQLGRLGSGQAQSYTNRLQRDKAIARFRQENVSVGRYEVVYAGPHRYGSVEQLYRAIFTPSLAYRFNVNEVILGVRDLDESRGNVLERRMALRKRLRESVESQVYFQRFDIEVRTGAVRAGGGRTSLPVSISLDPSLAGDTLEFLIELLGPDREPVAHVVDRILLPQPSPGDPEGGSPREFLYQTRLEARPGRYQLAVYATLEERKAAAFHNSDVELPDFSGPALSVSEVLLFRDVVRRSEASQIGSLPVRFLGGSRPPALRDFYLIPSADSRFRRRDNLTAFVEVYNPSLPDGAHPDIDLVCRFWQGDRLVATVPSKSLDYLTEAGGDRRTAYGISFPLRRFTPGRYRIELEVQDRQAGLSRTKSADFLIR